MSNRMTIQIYGSKYNIVTTEDKRYVQELASEIDRTVTELMQNNGMSVNQALVLMALSSLDAGKTAEENADNLRRQVSEYAEEAGRMRMEIADLRREMDRHQHG